MTKPEPNECPYCGRADGEHTPECLIGYRTEDYFYIPPGAGIILAFILIAIGLGVGEVIHWLLNP